MIQDKQIHNGIRKRITVTLILFVPLIIFTISGCGKQTYTNSPTRITSTSTQTITPSITVIASLSTTPSSEGLQPTTISTSTSNTIDQRIIMITAGYAHTCALEASGRVKCWGSNEFGQLGDGTQKSSNYPVEVVDLNDAKSITAGLYFTCALTRSNNLKCWGNNQFGQLGDGTTINRNKPGIKVDLPQRIDAYDVGDYHACAIQLGSQDFYCWGNNASGQLGDISITESTSPVIIRPLTKFGWPVDILSIATGGRHTCIIGRWQKGKIHDDLALICQGDNRYGQHGGSWNNGIFNYSLLTFNINSVIATGDGTCTKVKNYFCWGKNNYGQMELAAPNAWSFEPVALGWNHSCGSSGPEGKASLYCWGWNYFGQIGDGTRITRRSITRVKEIKEQITSIAVGWAHTCVATKEGTVKCWGANESGQLGDGTDIDRYTPVAVISP
jgi:alpha-tubulin suppressor-like RCC1 family protein